MKKLPIGIQTFSEIITENYCYVDKTDIAFKLINNGKYYFLSRPRRFGKSLFLDTLSEIFKGNKKIFEGLAIYDKWDWKTVYPVIKIDFGSGDFYSKEQINDSFSKILLENADRLGIEFTTTKNYSLDFKALINKVCSKYNQKVVILIDEYDKPIIVNIAHKEIALIARETLATFYSSIKSSDEYIKFVFMTGVSKFSKMNLFSSLNNINDITIDKNYATITGYTHKDLQEVFYDYLNGVNLDEIKKWYNGYNYLGESIYNPYDILLFLSKGCEFQNYWWETGNPRFLIELLKKNNYNFTQLDNMVVSKELLGSFDIDNIDLIALLWQTGYITFDKKIKMMGEVLYKMKIPNLEIQKSLNFLFAEYLTNLGAKKSNNQIQLYKDLKNSNFDNFNKTLLSLFASIPNNNYTKNVIANYEGYYASVIYTFIASIGFEVIAEDTTNVGRIDMTIKTENSIIIMEFKVDNKESAITQIKENKYYEKYLHDGREIYLVGINFDSKIKTISEFVWEKL